MHFDHIFVCSTNFNYCRFYNYAQWEILSIITNFNFCMPFFSMLSLFNLKIFLSLLKLAIINVFCKVSCRIWILKHGMNQAILFLVFFFIYFLKKLNFFLFFFNFFFLYCTETPKLNLPQRFGKVRLRPAN